MKRTKKTTTRARGRLDAPSALTSTERLYAERIVSILEAVPDKPRAIAMLVANAYMDGLLAGQGIRLGTDD